MLFSLAATPPANVAQLLSPSLAALLRAAIVAMTNPYAIRHDEPETFTAPPMPKRSANCVVTCYFSRCGISTDVTVSSLPLRSPLIVTEFSAEAFASSFSKPDST